MRIANDVLFFAIFSFRLINISYLSIYHTYTEKSNIYIIFVRIVKGDHFCGITYKKYVLSVSPFAHIIMMVFPCTNLLRVILVEPNLFLVRLFFILQHMYIFDHLRLSESKACRAGLLST